MTRRLHARRSRLLAATLAAGLALVGAFIGAGPASAASYVRISGEGSTWAANAWLDFASNAQRQGVTVDYTGNGSLNGRDDFARETSAVFADAEVPFTGSQSDPTDTTVPGFGYSMFPVVAGGTSLMYNLPVGGKNFTNLQLDLPTVAGIFTGNITQWNDPAIAATNPGVQLPAHAIDVVVRSDGSGATLQLKRWMLTYYPNQYKNLAQQTGVSATTPSSYFPTGQLGNFISQSGSTGVTTYVQNTPYTLNYDEYSYALQAGYPVAKVKNAAGFYTVPTQYAVAVALIAAKINTDQSSKDYLSQDLSAVYTYGDPRSYPLSMYSYEIVPTETNAVTSTAKGASLAWVSSNAVCSWQNDMGPLGYSPLPMNLVLAALNEIKKVPGIDSAVSSSIASTESGVLQGGTNPCGNPTFQAGDDPSHNLLVSKAPFPDGCDNACQQPWIGKDTSSGPNQSGNGTSTTGNGKGNGTSTTGNGKGNRKSNTGNGTSTTGTGNGNGTETGSLGTDDNTGTKTQNGDKANQGTQSGDTTTGHTTTGHTTTTACTPDPDTGLCADGTPAGSNTGTGTQTTTNAAVAQNMPSVLNGTASWGAPQWLGVGIGGLAFLVLIIAPPALIVSARRRQGGGR